VSIPANRPSDQGERPVRVVLLEPGHDAAAAAILAPCAPDRSVEGGQQLLAAVRADPHGEIYGLFSGNELAAVYVLKTIPFARELVCLVVREATGGAGWGERAWPMPCGARAAVRLPWSPPRRQQGSTRPAGFG
jgi:hypothetical protein